MLKIAIVLYKARLTCSLQKCRALRQPCESYRGHCNMRRSLNKMLVGGCGLPVCYMLSLLPLKMFYMGQKDELVLELTPIGVIFPPPNLRIIDYHVVSFSICLEKS